MFDVVHNYYTLTVLKTVNSRFKIPELKSIYSPVEKCIVYCVFKYNYCILLKMY